MKESKTIIKSFIHECIQTGVIPENLSRVEYYDIGHHLGTFIAAMHMLEDLDVDVHQLLESGALIKLI